MIAEVYDAFLAAGAPEEKARKAASALTAFEKKKNIRQDISDLRKDVAELKKDVAELKGEMSLIKWMVGFVLIFNLAILVKLLI